jgi:hypothetical protein
MKRQQIKTKSDWKMHVYYLDACNCDWGCPCQFNATPTHGNCEGLSGIHIIDGYYDHYNNTIRLNGLNIAFIGSWPGPIHEGHGKASYYVDYRANNSQFEALSKIILGKAGSGGPFALYASVIEEYDEVKRAHIGFEAKGVRSHMTIDNNGDDIVDAWLEPIRNPVTGKIHRAVIELPEGVEATRMDQASTKKLFVNNSHLKFRYEGTYGSFSENVWKG